MLRRLFFFSLLFVLLQANSTPASEGIQSAGAIKIQAAFLLKFCSYVKWPEESFSNPLAPITIGIIGRDPFGSVIDKIARSFVTDCRNVEIRRFKDIGSLRQVHMLFISPTDAVQMNKITTALSGHAVLLISNTPNFLEHSGMINFIMVGKKIRFNINRTNYEKAGLVISSKLLSVTHKIQ